MCKNKLPVSILGERSLQNMASQSLTNTTEINKRETKTEKEKSVVSLIPGIFAQPGQNREQSDVTSVVTMHSP